ncbi:MAG: MHS family MFS transporter [Acidobacteria bacterium]|nr:MHS family MFS transporter [Acidobacteriota bacterium]
MTDLDDRVRRRYFVRAVAASTVGTTVEWYDFYLYGAAAALVFPKLFFTNLDPAIGSILSYATFFAGFAARPVGAALFGHWGDRIGRKALLVITMLLMGVSTMVVGLLPTYERIGLWGAVLLTLLRAMQGIAVGGEWSGSVLMAGEWAQPARRGFATSFAQMGSPLGTIMANGALSIMSSSVDEAAFFEWGWRVPFLASIVLIVIGLWVRLGTLESPVFTALKAERKIVRAPIAEVLRTNWREVVMTMLLRTGQLAPFYITTTYVLTYGTQVLGIDRTDLLDAVSIRAVGSLAVLPLAGHLSDRFGRKRIIGIGCVGTGLWVFVLFALMNTRSMPLVVVGLFIDGILQDLQYGPQAAIIAENFPASRRYTGSGLGYHLAAITAGGPAPAVSAYLFLAFQSSTAIATYAFTSTLVSLATLPFLKDQAGTLDRT